MFIATAMVFAWTALVIAPTPSFGQDTGQFVLNDVPAYLAYHGSAPTTGMMVFGYWKAYGHDYLFPGSNSWQTNSAAIKNAIASPGHIADYALYGLPAGTAIDSSGIAHNSDGSLATPWEDYGAASPFPDMSQSPWGFHDDNCLADFMGTSRSSWD